MQSAVEAVRPRLASAALPDLELLDSAIRRVRDRWPDLAARPEEQPDVVVRKFRERYKRSHWNGTTVAFALRAAKVLFAADHSNRRLYDEPRVLDELRSFCIEVTKTSTQRSFVAGMMSIYLASYEPNSRWSQQLGNALDRARDQLVKGTKWATLIGHFPRVFRANRAHNELSSRMLRMHDPWREILDMGMWSPHAPGLMDHVHLEYVAKLDRSGKLRERAAVEGLLRWLRPDGKRGRATGVSEALEAILNPWRHSDPPQPLKDLLLERLVTCFGDPRMRAETWSTVREDCKSVIYRWLAGEDIRFFLDVVSAAEISHMWAPRRRFWLGLYEEGIVEAAWAAFSWQAERHAENSRKLEPDAQNIAFARQTGRRNSNTSLLILKIGNCIVVEGSHSYKVHVFRHDHVGVPKLFQDRYDCEAIRYMGNRPGVHAIAHYQGWQDRVREAIERLR